MTKRARRMMITMGVLVAGTASAFAAPSVLASRERSKAAGAMNYLSELRDAQKRQQIRTGRYAKDTSKLEVYATTPDDFQVSPIEPGSTGSLDSSFKVTATRKGLGPYGSYHIVFTEQGFDAKNSDVPDRIKPNQS